MQQAYSSWYNILQTSCRKSIIQNKTKTHLMAFEHVSIKLALKLRRSQMKDIGKNVYLAFLRTMISISIIYKLKFHSLRISFKSFKIQFVLIGYFLCFKCCKLQDYKKNQMRI